MRGSQLEKISEAIIYRPTWISIVITTSHGNDPEKETTQSQENTVNCCMCVRSFFVYQIHCAYFLFDATTFDADKANATLLALTDISFWFFFNTKAQDLKWWTTIMVLAHNKQPVHSVFKPKNMRVSIDLDDDSDAQSLESFSVSVFMSYIPLCSSEFHYKPNFRFYAKARWTQKNWMARNI